MPRANHARRLTSLGAPSPGRRVVPSPGRKSATLAVPVEALRCDFFGSEVRPRHGGAGYECLNGARFSVDADPATCAKAPWTCAATVGEIETCLSVFHEPNDLCGETKPECKAVLRCLPGLRVFEP